MKHTKHTTAHTHTHTHAWLNLIEGPLLIANLFTNCQLKIETACVFSSIAFSPYSHCFFCCFFHCCLAWAERKCLKEKCAKTRAKMKRRRKCPREFYLAGKVNKNFTYTFFSEMRNIWQEKEREKRSSKTKSNLKHDMIPIF